MYPVLISTFPTKIYLGNNLIEAGKCYIHLKQTQNHNGQ